MCQTTFSGGAGVTPFILLITDGLATSANGDFDEAAGPLHGRARAAVAKASGTQIETVFINPATQTPTLVSYMNDLSTSGTHHLAGDFDQLGTTVSNIAYNIACTTEVIAPGASPPVTPAPTPLAPGVAYCSWRNCDGTVQGGWCDESQTRCSGCSGQWCTESNPQPTPPPTPAPTPPTAGPYHCNCSTCTESVWNRWAGSWTCKARVEWMQTASQGYTEQGACNYVTNEYPDQNSGCPCNCNDLGGTWETSSEPAYSADCATCRNKSGCAFSSESGVKWCDKKSSQQSCDHTGATDSSHAALWCPGTGSSSSGSSKSSKSARR